MKKLISRRTQSSRQRGAVMFLLAASVLVVLLMGAIAVDLSVVANRGQSMQNAADSAALAGVQAYRESGGDVAAAELAVATLLQQNGIGPGQSTTFQVSFPDDVNDTEVTVTLIDSDPGTMLTGVTGVTSDVSRTATARFENCAASCTVNVVIPSPFRSVDAAGTGDGYKPIPVGTRLYALNHNSGYGGIVCIDRATEEQCWESGASKPAYATGANSQRNPEMPHTAVYGTKIYWTASDSSGTKLFCFETATATPCSSAVFINNREYADSSISTKDRMRGGGTVLANDKIFVFTDDWRVHCFVPDVGFGIGTCTGYESNGKPSFLALDGFPTNEPEDGNTGSSIDRVVDESNGYIYYTTHIADGGSNSGPPPDCSLDNQEFPNGLVSIQNVGSNLFVRARTNSTIGNSPDTVNDDTHWIAEAEGVDVDGNPRFSFRNVATNRYLDSDPGSPRDLDTSSSVSSDDKWTVNYQVTTSTIRSHYGTYAGDNGDFVTENGLNGQLSDWVIRHPACFNLGTTAGSYLDTVVPYGEGTYLQCWNSVAGERCNGFTPSRIHTNGQRFSGRLFLHMNSAGQVQGVCSSGFDDYIHPDNFEINCVDNFDGEIRSDLTDNMDTFENAIANITDSSPAAWGDPHYNADSNRVFYPSAHDYSRVLCWDFDYGYCGSVQGWSPIHGAVEDYGFFSEGDCVYGLGHNAIFWAFQAEDIFSECTGSTTRTHIEPCDCSGEWEWGTITFDVDLALFDEFFIQVENSNGDIVYPLPTIEDPDPKHSLHNDGLTVDLNHLPVSGDPDNDFLEILVSVSAENDPWAQGEQTFAVEFARAPRLTD